MPSSPTRAWIRVRCTGHPMTIASAQCRFWRVTGGARLDGEVLSRRRQEQRLETHGSRAACAGETAIDNLPAISDVSTMHELLGRSAAQVTESVQGRVDSAQDARA